MGVILQECGFGEAKGFLHRSSFIPPIYGESRVTCAACGRLNGSEGLERGVCSRIALLNSSAAWRGRECALTAVCLITGSEYITDRLSSLFKDIVEQGVQEVPFITEANIYSSNPLHQDTMKTVMFTHYKDIGAVKGFSM